jgi:hypothetical protein
MKNQVKKQNQKNQKNQSVNKKNNLFNFNIYFTNIYHL